MNRKTLFEVLLLITTAVVFGIVYTLLTKQGFFAETKPTKMHASSLEIISLERASTLFTADSAIFIDSRHDYDFKAGHIRGAVNIALNEFDKHSIRLKEIPKDKLLIIYCDGAECNSSIEVAIKLMEEGFTNIQVLFGGWQEWKANNLPIEK